MVCGHHCRTPARLAESLYGCDDSCQLSSACHLPRKQMTLSCLPAALCSSRQPSRSSLTSTTPLDTGQAGASEHLFQQPMRTSPWQRLRRMTSCHVVWERAPCNCAQCKPWRHVGTALYTHVCTQQTIVFSVHLSVRLSAEYLKNLWTDLYEIFWRGDVAKKESIRFWWLSGFFCRSWIIFHDSSPLWHRAYCDRCCHLSNVYKWSLHWLQVPERISFRLAVLMYRCLHGSAPGYLASDLQCISDLGALRRLRSSTTSALVAPRAVRATIGDRAFPATAASVWNSLPETVRSSPSLPVFCSRLKTELFAQFYSCSD